MKRKANSTLPLETEIEVVAIKGDTIIKQVMTYGKALNAKKAKGWSYTNYQLGFSSFKNTK